MLRIKQLEQAGQAAGVVRVHMGDGHEVEAADVMLPQNRGDHAGTDIELAIVGAAAVDEEVVALGGLDQNGVTGADIQKGDAKLAGPRGPVLPTRPAEDQERTETEREPPIIWAAARAKALARHA